MKNKDAKMKHTDKATELFLKGYNCAQAVALAFSDITGIDNSIMAKLASPFGGGMGRMREVCGAVSGMYIVLGILYGYDNAEEKEGKKQLYADVQALADAFRKQNGSIICRDILKNPPSDPTPSARTDEYYSSRPCVRMVQTAVNLLDDFISSH